MHSAGRVLAHALDVCKTENQTRDTTHGGARLEAPSPVCRKRPFTTHADRLAAAGAAVLAFAASILTAPLVGRPGTAPAVAAALAAVPVTA